MTVQKIMAGAALLLWSVLPAGAETIQVKVDKLTFAPARVTAHVGDTIEWVNADFIPHTATARNKAWDVTIARGKTAQTVIKTAGTIDYYCRFHPNMTGTIVVQEK